PHEQSGRDGWPAWLSIAGFATGYGTTIVLGLFVIVIAGAFGASTKDPPPGVNIGLTVGQNVALVGAAYFFACLGGRPAAADFGLRPAPVWRSVRLLVAVWIAFFVLSAIWAVVLKLDEQQTLPDELGANGPLLNALAVIVLVTVIAPLGEELFFRGFFFGALRNWRGPILAGVLTGAVFGLIHVGSAPIGYLVPLAIFGAGLCLLYELTGSLYPAIALHALNNSIALGANLDYGAGVIVAMMAGSTIAALLCARLLAKVIGDRRPARPANAPAPEPV
ncbi:MAG: protease family protein, partial [Solirubrobacteraceae bacterium]|nr:protease family protein [Solirubrobacteraceae bacterium]